MRVEFKLHTPPPKRGENGELIEQEPTEYVDLCTGRDGGGKDAISRPATDADREQYAEAYAAFKAGPEKPAEAEAAPVGDVSKPAAPVAAKVKKASKAKK